MVGPHKIVKSDFAFRKTAVPISEDYDSVHDAEDDFHQTRRKPRLEDVPVENLRATQYEVRASGKPASKHHPDMPMVPALADHPVGVKDPETGHVHLFDGHNRADAAVRRGDKTIKVYTKKRTW